MYNVTANYSYQGQQLWKTWPDLEKLNGSIPAAVANVGVWAIFCRKLVSGGNYPESRYTVNGMLNWWDVVRCLATVKSTLNGYADDNEQNLATTNNLHNTYFVH